MIFELIKAVLAGVAISIGGVVFLSTLSMNKIAAALLFSLGLFTVCALKLNLFTGKVGYLSAQKNRKELGKYGVFLLVVFIGNFIGAALSAFLINLTRAGTALAPAAQAATEARFSDNYLSIFILSIFCGILMFVAVECFTKLSDPVGRYLAIIMCVSVFILAGFEHCVANMFYFAMSGGLYSLNGIVSVLVSAAGNSVGSLLISFPLIYFSSPDRQKIFKIQ